MFRESDRRRKRCRPRCRRWLPGEPPRAACRRGAARRREATRGRPFAKDERSLVGAELDDGAGFGIGDADQIDRADQPIGIDNDANQIAVADFSDRAAGQRFGSDVADAGTGADAGKPCVGEHGDLAAALKML